MAESDSAPTPPTAAAAAAAAPLTSSKKDNVTSVSAKIAELNESRSEIITRIQSLKQDLQGWRSKLDTQVKIYRDELSELKKSLNVEVEQLRSEFQELRTTLQQQQEDVTASLRNLGKKLGYAVLLEQGFPHYKQLHEILRGRLATGGMAINSTNPPTPMQLDAMEHSYIANQANRRAGKQPMSEPLESAGSSDSPPPSAERLRSQQQNMRQNRRRKADDLRSNPIIGEALDMIQTYTNSMSPSAIGPTKRSKSVSSPQKSNTQACMDLAKTICKDLTTYEYVDLIMLMRDDFNRTVFLTIAGTTDSADIEIMKMWINKAKHC